MASTMPALLSPAHIALVDSGISAIVASRDAQLRPSLMRAVGTHISGMPSVNVNERLNLAELAKSKG